MKEVRANALLWFPKGDYAQAIRHYAFTKAWCVETGLVGHQGISGLIQSPLFKGQKSPAGVVPNELIDQPEWRFVMLLHLEHHQDLTWLQQRITEVPCPDDSVFIHVPVEQIGKQPLRLCRVCYCTEDHACVTKGVPCHWVEKDLCSACAIGTRNLKPGTES